MYGMVNKAIEDMVRKQAGDSAWNQIRERAGVDVGGFISNEPYPDAVTLSLVAAASERLSLTVTQVLEAFGRHWVLYTAREGYGGLLEASGRDLREFLVNLPNFHTRIHLMFPDLVPPEFECDEETDGTLRLSYRSRREGLAPLVRGILAGLGEMYGTTLQVAHSLVRGESGDHDEFRITVAEPS